MSEYRYSGRNTYGKDIPRLLKVEKLKEKPSKTIFECRIYDKNGKLKKVIKEREIIEKGIKKIVKTRK